MKQCVSKVNAMFIEQYVLLMMQNKLEADGELERLHMEEADRLGQEIGKLKEERRILLAKRERLKQQNFEAYQEYASGKTDAFQSDNLIQESIEKELKALDKSLEMMEENYIHMRTGRNKPYTGSTFAELSKEMLGRYIEKIEVYDEQHIEIYWKDAKVKGVC